PDQATLTSVVVIVFAAALAPLAADAIRRWLVVPATVLEILFGILIGPAVLDLAQVDRVVDALAGLGLALLFFLAGYEIDFTRTRGGPMIRALGSWAGSLVLGLAVGALLGGARGAEIAAMFGIGLALASTALGTILPMVRDSGVLGTSLGADVLAVGAVGEFAPILTVAVLLSTERPVHATVLLLAFAAVALAAAGVAMRRTPQWLLGPVTATLSTSAQFAVRLSVLAVVAMVWLGTELHLDLVLGAFAAGVVMRLVLASVSEREAATVESKLEGLGFGMLVPFFFVTTGLQFDLDALVSDVSALVLVPIALAALLVVRGLPVALGFRPRPGRARAALALYAATTLPMVVVITNAGVMAGWLDPATAAGLVGAAMLSVLVYPLLAQRVHQPAGERD